MDKSSNHPWNRFSSVRGQLSTIIFFLRMTPYPSDKERQFAPDYLGFEPWICHFLHIFGLPFPCAWAFARALFWNSSLSAVVKNNDNFFHKHFCNDLNALLYYKSFCSSSLFPKLMATTSFYWLVKVDSVYMPIFSLSTQFQKDCYFLESVPEGKRWKNRG